MNVLWEKTASASQRRNFLRSMVNNKVFKFGEFTLKSGQVSPIYIDLRECFGYADLMDLASECLTDLIVDSSVNYTGIVGVPYAALPYSTLVAQKLKQPLIIIRKEAKSYGTKKLIEGLYEKDQKVIVIEDVVTTGGSLIDVINTLRADGLVVNDVYCLLDRQQGGAAKLKEHGVTLYSLLNMETVLSFLLSLDIIQEDSWRTIVSSLNLGLTNPHKFAIAADMENPVAYPMVNSGRLPLNERSRLVNSVINKELFSLMVKKESNLCLALDYTEADKILELADKAGPFVICIKVHCDAIADFSETFTSKLVELSKKHEFLILEDRKFADIGNTNMLQLKGSHKIAEWADLVTVHAVQGFDSIDPIFREVINDNNYRLKGILLISQLSSLGALTALKGYSDAVAKKGQESTDIVSGFICQTKVSTDSSLLHWTPGVNLEKKTDGTGQQWRTVEQAIAEQQNDIIIVGRGVTNSAQPVQELKKYREAGWSAFINK